MRRTIGLGGAAFVAMGAALVLTLPASAHNNTSAVECTDGVSSLTVNLSNYGDGPNSVVVTVKSSSTPLVTNNDFTPAYKHTFTTDGKVAQEYHIVVKAHSSQFDVNQTLTTDACPAKSGGGDSSTTQPPTTTAAPSPTLKPAATATTTAALAAASGSGQLPNTGVNAGVPLLVAGVLVVAGGGILLWMRLSAKRRRTDS
jgi:LPXTG-motif cell wall-anchored protein